MDNEQDRRNYQQLVVCGHVKCGSLCFNLCFNLKNMSIRKLELILRMTAYLPNGLPDFMTGHSGEDPKRNGKFG